MSGAEYRQHQQWVLRRMEEGDSSMAKVKRSGGVSGTTSKGRTKAVDSKKIKTKGKGKKKAKLVQRRSPAETPPKKRGKPGPRVAGKKWGLNMADTWIRVFAQNSEAPKAKRLTDDQISQFMKKEFPQSTAYQVNCAQGVQAVRNLYNKGRMCGHEGEIPKVLSVRCDKSGEPLKGRLPGAGRKE